MRLCNGCLDNPAQTTHHEIKLRAELAGEYQNKLNQALDYWHEKEAPYLRGLFKRYLDNIKLLEWRFIHWFKAIHEVIIQEQAFVFPLQNSLLHMQALLQDQRLSVNDTKSYEYLCSDQNLRYLCAIFSSEIIVDNIEWCVLFTEHLPDFDQRRKNEIARTGAIMSAIYFLNHLHVTIGDDEEELCSCRIPLQLDDEKFSVSSACWQRALSNLGL